jgi:3-oxoacyl-[acyl-carrier-protein] synthase II
MNRRVVVTGLGVVSSIGDGWQRFWDSLLEGKSGISPVSSFDASGQFTRNAGEIRDFRPEKFVQRDKLSSLSRSSQLGLAAAELAVADAGIPPGTVPDKRIGVCIGTTMGSVQTVEIIDELLLQGREEACGAELLSKVPTHSTPAAISRAFKLRGPNMMFSTACAAGNYAIGYGFDLIKSGRTDVILAGGADPLSKVAFTGFNQFSAVAPERCQPFDKNRKGMIPAEGAGMLVLESLESAIRRKARIFAEILGYGLSCDAYHMTTASVEGLSECMKKAMQEAGISRDEVSYISAHGTGTVANDRNECAAIREVFGSGYQNVPVSSIKSMLGHTMGAASALEAIACALAVKNDMLPPTINFETPDPECDVDCVPNVARSYVVNIALNNSYAFGGNNASVVFKKYSDEERKDA